MGLIIRNVVPLAEKLELLKQQLSHEASIDFHTEEGFQISSQRWSDYNGPKPGAVVNVASEKDIEETVAWATSNGVKFVAQTGGHGWTSTFSVDIEGIVINLRKLNSVTVAPNTATGGGTITFGAGALVREVVEEAAKNKVHVTVGTCNSVGAVGACIGGGMGRFQGFYGLGVDNMISARLVTAAGKCIDVSADENADLWWGLRGAGHNFGIISSLTLKAYPELNEGMHWISLLVFTPDKIEDVIKAINRLDFDKGLALHIFFMPVPPNFQPAVAVNLWYPGPESTARETFASLFSLGPVFEQSGMTPYNLINAGADDFGKKGGLKHVWSASLSHLSPPLLTEIWQRYFEFVTEHKDAAGSVVMIECYSNKKVLQSPASETSFPFAQRSLPYHALMIPMWTEPGTTDAADIWGRTSRELLRMDSGMKENNVYVNFASGDEKKEMMYGYGGNVDILRDLKAKWDPERVFSQYNPVC